MFCFAFTCCHLTNLNEEYVHKVPLCVIGSSQVQINDTLPELRKTASEVSETLSEVTKAPASVGSLEMPEEVETVGCCFFRMPKFKFSFKMVFSLNKIPYCS